MQRIDTEIVVIGGGLVGLSVGLGLLRRGAKVIIVDGTDDDHSASRGNFGLVWLSGKGAHYAPYARWTRRAIRLWPEFAKDIEAETGVDVRYQACGGYELFIDEVEWRQFAADLEEQNSHFGTPPAVEVLDGAALRARHPEIGSAVVGGTYSPEDGHVDPLKLLFALTKAFIGGGGRLLTGAPVTMIEYKHSLFRAEMRDKEIRAPKLVLAAGLGAAHLGPLVGFRAEVEPSRGQLLITERLPQELPILTSTVRQVAEGGVQIGGTREEVGPDRRETLDKTGWLASEAIKTFPMLSRVNVVRSWAALRVMTPDGYPIYAKSTTHPGAYLVTCHSGVTLAAAHLKHLPGWVLDDEDAIDVSAFDESRFPA